MQQAAVPEGRAARQSVFYGWYIALACSVIAFFSWGLGFYGQGIYLNALNKLHGWPTSLISLAITVYYFVSAAIVVWTGSIIDRHGARSVMAYGVLAMGSSVAALGFITEVWQLFAAYLVLATGWATLGATAISGAIVPWFVRQRSKAMTIALTGPSVGGMVLVPLLVSLTERASFRTATLVAAAMLVVIVLPLLALVIRRRPQDMGLLPDGVPMPDVAAITDAGAMPDGRRWTRGAVLRTPLFWTLLGPFLLAILCQVGFLVHQLSYVEPVLGRASGAFVVSATAFAALLGRVIMGMLVDKMDTRVFAAGCFGVQAVALAALALVPAPVVLYGASIVFGLGVGIVITLPPLLVHEEFGSPSFATIFSLVSAGMQAGVAFGPGLLGVTRDVWGSYQGAVLLFVVLEAAAVALVLAGRGMRFIRPS